MRSEVYSLATNEIVSGGNEFPAGQGHFEWLSPDNSVHRIYFQKKGGSRILAITWSEDSSFSSVLAPDEALAKIRGQLQKGSFTLSFFPSDLKRESITIESDSPKYKTLDSWRNSSFVLQARNHNDWTKEQLNGKDLSRLLNEISRPVRHEYEEKKKQSIHKAEVERKKDEEQLQAILAAQPQLRNLFGLVKILQKIIAWLESLFTGQKAEKNDSPSVSLLKPEEDSPFTSRSSSPVSDVESSASSNEGGLQRTNSLSSLGSGSEDEAREGSIRLSRNSTGLFAAHSNYSPRPRSDAKPSTLEIVLRKILEVLIEAFANFSHPYAVHSEIFYPSMIYRC